MKIKEIMRTTVFTIKSTDTLGNALEIFEKYSVTGFPVINRKREVVGVITQTDILNIMDVHSKLLKADSGLLPLVLGIIKNEEHFEDVKQCLENVMNLKVGKIMQTDVKTISPEEDVYKAIRTMNKYDINRLPVVDKNKLTGIVSRGDIINALEEKDN